MFNVILLCASSVLAAILLAEKDWFEMRMRHPVGVLGCTKLCEERRACVNVSYSSNRLVCVLQIKYSFCHSSYQKPERLCGDSCCVFRFVQKSSGRIVEISENFNQKYDIENPKKYIETKLSFTLEKNRCHNGENGSIIEPHPRADMNMPCEAESAQIFLKNESYSWVIRSSQTSTTSHAFFMLQPPEYGRYTFNFQLKNDADTFEISEPGNKWINLNTRSEATLKFILSGRYLRVIDLKKNIGSFPMKSRNPSAIKSRLRVSVFGMTMVCY